MEMLYVAEGGKKGLIAALKPSGRNWLEGDVNPPLKKVDISEGALPGPARSARSIEGMMLVLYRYYKYIDGEFIRRHESDPKTKDRIDG